MSTQANADFKTLHWSTSKFYHWCKEATDVTTLSTSLRCISVSSLTIFQEPSYCLPSFQKIGAMVDSKTQVLPEYSVFTATQRD